MTNASSYLQLQNNKALIMESYSEVVEFMSVPSDGATLTWVIVLLFTGWCLSLGTMWLASALPLQKRTPSKAVFFAAFHEKIRRNFPSQKEDTFNTLITGTNRVLRTNTEEPTVFLVLVPSSAMPTAKRLVTLLVHCILIAYRYPAGQSHVKYLITDGNSYTSHNEEWPFFYRIRKHLRFYGVSALFSFENVHPQAVRTLQLLLPLTIAPYPESVLILVVDLRNRFTEYQKQHMSPNTLGRIFLQDLLGPYFDQNELLETINQIGSRCILIAPEGIR